MRETTDASGRAAHSVEKAARSVETVRVTVVEREALSMSEAAAAAGVSRTTLYQLLAAGGGPPTIRVGRRRLIRVEALREWLIQREERP